LLIVVVLGLNFLVCFEACADFDMSEGQPPQLPPKFTATPSSLKEQAEELVREEFPLSTHPLPSALRMPRFAGRGKSEMAL